MSLSTIYGKSGKGAQVLTGKSKSLPADSMRVLAQIDGKSNAGAIMATLEKFSEQELTQILTQLLNGGYIRVIADDSIKDFFSDSGVASTIDVVEISAEEFLKTEASAHDLDSDVKKRQQKEAEARAKAHAEEQLRLEAAARAQEESERQLLEVTSILANSGDEIDIKKLAEQKAREEAAAKAKAEAEAEAKAKREAEEKARREAEAKAKREAEERARLAAEQKAREEAAAKAKAEAEAEAEAKAKREAEEKAREGAKEAVLRAKAETEARAKQAGALEETGVSAEQEAEEKMRIAAEEEKERKEAERTALQQAEAEEKAKAEQEAKREAAELMAMTAEEKAREWEEREPVDIGKWLRKALAIGRKLLISVSVTALVVLFLLQLVNLSMLVSPLVGPIQKLVSENINEPVTIRKVYASLWPKPHLVLDGVTIGDLADIKITTVRVLPTLSTIFDDVKTLKYIEISGMAISQDNLQRPMQWVSAANKRGKLKFDQVLLDKTSVSLRGLELPPFNGDIKLTPAGKLQSATLNTDDRSAVVQITPRSNDYMVDLVANDWRSPIGAPVVFSELHAAGVIEDNKMTFSQIKGRLYGGNLRASMTVDWMNFWAATGTFKLSEVELEELIPNFTKEASFKGPLTSSATFTLQANELATLFDTPEINADFTVDEGALDGIDLARAMRTNNKSGAASGSTRFKKFSGKLLLKDGHYQYRQLALKAGKLSASGEADIEANRYLSGKIDVNLAMQSRQFQSHFNLSGSLANPILK